MSEIDYEMEKGHNKAGIFAIDLLRKIHGNEQMSDYALDNVKGNSEAFICTFLAQRTMQFKNFKLTMDFKITFNFKGTRDKFSFITKQSDKLPHQKRWGKAEVINKGTFNHPNLQYKIYGRA